MELRISQISLHQFSWICKQTTTLSSNITKGAKHVTSVGLSVVSMLLSVRPWPF